MDGRGDDVGAGQGAVIHWHEGTTWNGNRMLFEHDHEVVDGAVHRMVRVDWSEYQLDKGAAARPASRGQDWITPVTAMFEAWKAQLGHVPDALEISAWMAREFKPNEPLDEGSTPICGSFNGVETHVPGCAHRQDPFGDDSGSGGKWGP